MSTVVGISVLMVKHKDLQMFGLRILDLSFKQGNLQDWHMFLFKLCISYIILYFVWIYISNTRWFEDFWSLKIQF